MEVGCCIIYGTFALYQVARWSFVALLHYFRTSIKDLLKKKAKKNGTSVFLHCLAICLTDLGDRLHRSSNYFLNAKWQT